MPLVERQIKGLGVAAVSWEYVDWHVQKQQLGSLFQTGLQRWWWLHVLEGH